MKKNVSDETLEKIICDKLFFGLKTEEVAKKHNLSKSFVSAAVAAYKDVEAGNWEHIKFMLDGAQVNVKVVEWAASRIGVEIPALIHEPKPDPKALPLDGQTKLDEFGKKIDGDTTVKFGTSANNTIHALIDALNRNADESAQLRKAIFGLLHSAGCAE